MQVIAYTPSLSKLLLQSQLLNCIDPAVFFYLGVDYFGPTQDKHKFREFTTSSKTMKGFLKT